MEFQGKRRLFFLSSDGYINLYDDDLTMCGFVDEVGASDGEINLAQVSDEVVTRGYTANDIAQKNGGQPKFTLLLAILNLLLRLFMTGQKKTG